MPDRSVLGVVFYRLRFELGRAIAAAICIPKRRLGRRRHENICDKCGDPIGSYAMERMDFPLDDLDPDASTSREKIRAMLNADYERVCLDCGSELEADQDE